ncbi:MAG: hypothetical protein ACSHXI_16430 [Hoeflea sp.]|uniref:hypothetical protein n=1 Tax=Hoeflea sp. TaxID=1940281 RepID=UPI003EFA8517
MSNEKPTTAIEIGQKGNAIPKPALTIDYALYERYLEESDLSEDQKREFLETLWSVIVGFVDLGFGVHPLQQSGASSCGEELDLSREIGADVLISDQSKTSSNFRNAAARKNNERREREEI